MVHKRMSREAIARLVLEFGYYHSCQILITIVLDEFTESSSRFGRVPRVP